jgi:single stranded DNA-binding protein
MSLYGINEFHISGRLTRDPEYRSAQNGNEYANISIATSLYSKSNPKQTLFIDCYVYGSYLINSIKNNSNYKRGASVFVAGNIQGYTNRVNKTTDENLTTLKLNVVSINQIEFPSVSSDNSTSPQTNQNNQYRVAEPDNDYETEDDVPF